MDIFTDAAGQAKPQSLYSLILVIICFAPQFKSVWAAEAGSICNNKEPKADQVCISIKFPWEAVPVFFCTGKSNVSYVRQCTDAGQTHHCPDDGRHDTLKIATPWDCCPRFSSPHPCSPSDCPPAPFNRTCMATQVTGQCCPSYFCETGEPENCKALRLKHSCVNPPKGKENCTAYRDPFGCCNFYQCASDEKPGTCPRFLREARQAEETDGFFKRTIKKIVNGAKETVNKVATKVKSTLENHGGSIGKTISKSIPIPFQQTNDTRRDGRDLQLQLQISNSTLRCSGDHTCPGTMKCCPLSPPQVNYRRARHEVRTMTIVSKSSHSTATLFAAQLNLNAGTPDHQSTDGTNRSLDGYCFDPEGGSALEVTSQAPTVDVSTTVSPDTTVRSNWRSTPTTPSGQNQRSTRRGRGQDFETTTTQPLVRHGSTSTPSSYSTSTSASTTPKPRTARMTSTTEYKAIEESSTTPVPMTTTTATQEPKQSVEPTIVTMPTTASTTTTESIRHLITKAPVTEDPNEDPENTIVQA